MENFHLNPDLSNKNRSLNTLDIQGFNELIFIKINTIY